MQNLRKKHKRENTHAKKFMKTYLTDLGWPWPAVA